MTLTRRGLLLAGGGLLLAGCGDKSKLNSQRKALARRSVAIDYASYYAPFPTVKAHALAHAQEVGAAVTFSDDADGSAAQVANMKRWTSERGGFNAIAVAPFDAAAIDPIAAAGMKRGVKIVAYVTELEHQTAAITVDRGRAGQLLAEDAKAHGAPDGVVLVTPAAADPFAPGFADAERAIRAALPVAVVVKAQAQADAEAAVRAALRSTPSRVVLTWNDTTALGAAAALGGRGYAGGVGAPSLTSADSVAALRRGGALRCLVAARVATLAEALVDLPLALARGEKAGDRAVPVEVLRRGSPQLAAFARDFGR